MGKSNQNCVGNTLIPVKARPTRNDGDALLETQHRERFGFSCTMLAVSPASYWRCVWFKIASLTARDSIYKYRCRLSVSISHVMP